MPTKDTFYFSHDYNARNDEKILEIRSLYGAEGYGVFWMIVETMAENEDGRLNTHLIGGLSLSYGLAIDKLKLIIDSCISVGLFSKDREFIFSGRLSKHKETREEFRKERSESGSKGARARWASSKKEEKSCVAQPIDSHGSAIAVDSKGKERKGKEIIHK